MDFIDGLPKVKGYEVIMVVVEMLSNHNQRQRYGVLEQFLAGDICFTRSTSVQLNMSSAYHPQSDSQTEVAPLIHLPYIPGESAASEVDNILTSGELKLQLLKHHLSRAQLRMKNEADKHMSDRSFQVGDWMYLKVQPYKQTTISSQPYQKLAAKFNRPFQVTKSIGSVPIHFYFQHQSKSI
ncbi:uncharacterized protein LOC142173735 [Nicotiana tabacum]|uniref:Uncharacterized protein LOC142173735 n=1 Tax=Nicotiana tabacum TaxID=4097 RepID=A0AC58TE12_TOBAC